MGDDASSSVVIAVPHQSSTKPVVPDSRSELLLGSGKITPSDRTDINPLNGWLYGGPGFKSRRLDDLKAVKTRSGRQG